MAKISFRIVPASRESISHVQTGAARKPNRCDLRRQAVLALEIARQSPTLDIRTGRPAGVVDQKGEPVLEAIARPLPG
ncbi:hypothetical protein E1264_07045 [Actinomadura sp. KC216]|uniref:hypothetical protein n=1 Tax=Actinomadura sp. KC216 TaxID=2530370 RepID=UPI0010456B84|nr:hypothetical protein [Actinomadura sp. KC216]TDB89850.1 hypothetical protein E1264_07045 [Actinomadura sp. KC216]